jgi:phosphatidylethanolamine/phosphatidyl-N-methylethanolamine N-methyltransferase
MVGVKFLREFLTKPATIGAIAPSSRFLARTIIEAAGVRDADTVLEYGPGTGAFTEFILRDLRPGAKFAAIELNPRFAEVLRSRFPLLHLFEDSVVNVRAICESAGMLPVDCIISGLPWATFEQPLQVSCLDAMMQVLKPGGRFVTFTYFHSQALAGSRNFSKLLTRYFSVVSKGRVIWLNMPPAFTYRCLR